MRPLYPSPGFMRLHVEDDPVRAVVNLYFIESDSAILRVLDIETMQWETIPEGTSPTEPSLRLPRFLWELVREHLQGENFGSIERLRGRMEVLTHVLGVEQDRVNALTNIDVTITPRTNWSHP